jgi:hypothetical protein
MGEYIVLEIGDSACVEFKTIEGDFEPTEDAVVVGIVQAISEEDAIEKATKLEYCRNRDFDKLVAYALR